MELQNAFAANARVISAAQELLDKLMRLRKGKMTSVGKTMYPLANGIKNITTMKARYDALQTQLSTGQKASTLAEMGADRYFDMALRQRMARIDGYQQASRR